jgi:hypothetical protein
MIPMIATRAKKTAIQVPMSLERPIGSIELPLELLLQELQFVDGMMSDFNLDRPKTTKLSTIKQNPTI